MNTTQCTLTDSLPTNVFDGVINDVRLTLGAAGFVPVDQEGTTLTFRKYSREGLWLSARVFVAIDEAQVRNETTGEVFEYITIASLIEAFS